MKKLIAALITVSCLLLIVSCSQTPDNTPKIPVSEGGVSFAEFVKAAGGTASPASAIINTKSESDLGVLNAQLVITYAADGSSEIEYVKDRYGKISAGEDLIVTEAGSVSCDANGNYSDGGEFVGNAVASGAYSLNLVESKLRDAKIEGNILYATIFSYETQAVLGINLGATTLVAITIKDGKIGSVSASYFSGTNKINVECEYIY